MRIIDGDALRDVMYHEAFETDSDMQRWDSGCWIRYKMFEKAIDNAPTVDTVEVVRCEECIHNESSPHNPICSEGNRAGAGWFCADGERREDGDNK